MQPCTLVEKRVWAPGLITLKLNHSPSFAAGQFFNLGFELDGKLVRRSYSAASAPGEPLEFFITEVPEGQLSPKLLALDAGDEVLLDPAPQGFFSLGYIPQAKHAWLLATGTGIGPFISMLREGGLFERFERVVLVHGVRESSHLGYAEELKTLQRERAEQLRYIPCVSREQAPPGGLSGRIPSHISSGQLETQAELQLSPEESHVLICGNPQMIEDTQGALAPRGLQKHRVRKPGHISFEKYW